MHALLLSRAQEGGVKALVEAVEAKKQGKVRGCGLTVCLRATWVL